MSDVEVVIDGVARDLAWLEPEPVFVGGATIGLFLDAFGRSQVRPTEDVDCIVPEVVSRTQWWELEAQLRDRRWLPDPTGPTCRYRSPQGTVVDLMPEEPDVLGFASRWYPDVVRLAERRSLSTGRAVLVPPPVLLLACKLEAYGSRGVADPFGSKDLEDIAALLDGCRELEASVASAPAPVRRWVADALTQVRQSTASWSALEGQLPRSGDAHAQELRIERLLGRLCRGGAGQER